LNPSGTVEEKFSTLNSLMISTLSKTILYGALVFFILIILDTYNYTIINESGIEYRSYGSMIKHHKGWQQLNKIVVGCKYETNYTELDFTRQKWSYNLVFKDGSTMDMYKYRSMKNKVRDLEMINVIARAYEVPIEFKSYDGLAIEASETRCNDYLLHTFKNTEDYELMKKLILLK
jgi:hypothetical protein